MKTGKTPVQAQGNKCYSFQSMDYREKHWLARLYWDNGFCSIVAIT